MKINRVFIFLLTSITISLNLYSHEYEATLIGTESLPIPENCHVQWSVTGINDKGQIYGGYEQNELFKSSKELIYLYDSKDGIIFIEDDARQLYPQNSIANNKGQIVGTCGGKPNIFLFSNLLGFRNLDFSEIFEKYKTERDSNIYIDPIALNDFGQLIVTYYMHSTGRKPLLWDNGVIYEMGTSTDFSKNFEELGYHIMDLQISSINNNGELAGYFCYGKFSEKRNQYVKAGYKAFFWNGDIHIIDLQSGNEPPNVLKVNNMGVVLLTEDIRDEYHDTMEVTYLWDLNNGLKSLINFRGIDLNDSSIVLGDKREYNRCDWYRVPAIWKNDQCLTIAELLGVSNIENMAPPYSDEYLIEKLDIESFAGINNQGQIVCIGTLWGEQHPCILKPTNKPKEQSQRD